MIDLLLKGGIMMIPLFISSVLVVAIVIDRIWYLYKAEVNEHELYEKVKENYITNGPEAAIAFCDKTGGPIAAVLKSGLQEAGKGREKIEDAFEREALIELPRLKKNLMSLSTIGSIATLLGFTGTVIGMIKAFNSIASAGTTSPGIVAGGIAEALTTTAVGLVVAIIALVSYYYLSYRVDRILLELEKLSRNLINIMEDN